VFSPVAFSVLAEQRRAPGFPSVSQWVVAGAGKDASARPENGMSGRLIFSVDLRIALTESPIIHPIDHQDVL